MQPIDPIEIAENLFIAAVVSRWEGMTTYLGFYRDGRVARPRVVRHLDPRCCDPVDAAAFTHGAQLALDLGHLHGIERPAEVILDESGQPLLDLLSYEYVFGKDLRTIWNRCATKAVSFPLYAAVFIIQRIAEALQRADDELGGGFVHSICSPDKILIGHTGAVVLGGLHRSYSKRRKPNRMHRFKYSYLSPEQARSALFPRRRHKIDHRADQYVIGIVLWEMLTGRQFLPTSAGSQTNRLQAALDPVTTSPSALAPRVPPSLDEIVMRALSPKRRHRYRNCGAFAAALAAWRKARGWTGEEAGTKLMMESLFSPDDDYVLLRRHFAAAFPMRDLPYLEVGAY